ncbi:MAG TPA: hypothetical protein VEJ46_09160 [Candidatus Acidoferrum sp.]|nr:hypothetical protein [Candidatus Acidoferrum sp.]
MLHPVASSASVGSAGERLSHAADFVAALMRSGACKVYELDCDQWVLEVRLPPASGAQQWKH